MDVKAMICNTYAENYIHTEIFSLENLKQINTHDNIKMDLKGWDVKLCRLDWAGSGYILVVGLWLNKKEFSSPTEYNLLKKAVYKKEITTYFCQ
jgi:hypothetical protein